MQITFKRAVTAQPITEAELNESQILIGMILSEDYRQHMLTYNGGGAMPLGFFAHTNLYS